MSEETKTKFTPRTQDEIVARINSRKREDFLGFEQSDLLNLLDYTHAKPFLKPETTEAEWKKATSQFENTRESILKQMQDYMPFAWEKANGCRGISASRSMSHFMSWTWLAGDDFGDLLDYQHYGKDNLKRICEHYGWDSSQWDDGRRVNDSSEL